MKTQLKPGKHRVSLKYESGPESIDLRGVSRVIPLPAHGAEDVIAFGASGVLCGTEDGQIIRVNCESNEHKALLNTGGRPLGLELCADGSLIVCDSFKGLLRFRPGADCAFNSTPEVLATSVNGQRLRFCSNASEAPDGSIWFTESTSRFHFPEFMGAILEHAPRGSLNCWHPDGTVTRVLDNRYFANGVIVEPDGTGVFFCETTDYALRRYDCVTQEVQTIAGNLPGFPDNMSPLSERNETWIAYAHPRSLPLDLLAKVPNFFSHIVWNMPDAIRPDAPHEVWLNMWKFNESAQNDKSDCKWERSYQIRGTHPDFHTPTAAVRMGDDLIVASKDQSSLLAIDLTKVL
ncbi:SMP-30/gluconolactonase/LRE family protein [Corynebacterium amycolatum]|uniref:SMP-30/gluconolactonase/LRE family protein n=1 Tax=Corynebacterium amycolatum TaxID=43765 RepID=UPI003B5A466E